MKKLLLALCCVFTTVTLFAQSKVYTEPLVVSINGASSEPQDASVTVVDNGNGTINFVLKNFILVAGEDVMPVGNINVENIPVKKGEDGLDYISFNDSIILESGDMEGVDMWMGPIICAQVGKIPLDLTGKMNDEKLFATIGIDLKDVMGQMVNVQLGTDNFFTQSKVYTEPLVVSINGASSEPQDASVTVVDNGNGTINFVLKNFILVAGEDVMPVGNINVENIPVKKGEDGLDYISFNDSIILESGDMEGVDMWMGPIICAQVGKIPLDLTGKMSDEKLFATIDINLKDVMGQVVNVQLGTDFNDNQDAIVGIAPVRSSSDAIYDLNGCKINSQLKKGIYVVGGKKVVF